MIKFIGHKRRNKGFILSYYKPSHDLSIRIDYGSNAHFNPIIYKLHNSTEPGTVALHPHKHRLFHRRHQHPTNGRDPSSRHPTKSHVGAPTKTDRTGKITQALSSGNEKPHSTEGVKSTSGSRHTNDVVKRDGYTGERISGAVLRDGVLGGPSGGPRGQFDDPGESPGAQRRGESSHTSRLPYPSPRLYALQPAQFYE